MFSADRVISHHPFGAASTSSNAGMITNAALDIWESEGVPPVLKYEDDLNAFHYSSAKGPFIDGNFQYDYDCTEILKRISHLGIPWHKEKGNVLFMPIMTFIGFLWTSHPGRLAFLLSNNSNSLTMFDTSLTASEDTLATSMMLRESAAPFTMLPLYIQIATPVYHPSPTLLPHSMGMNSLLNTPHPL